MNILFLTYQGDMAGSTNSIIYLSKGLAERGHSVFVGCRRESMLYHELEKTSVHLIPMTFKSKFDLKNMKQISEVVKTYKIDLVNAQSSKDRYTSMFSRWYFGWQAKIVFTRRQYPMDMNFLKNILLEKGADKIVVVSEGLKEIFLKKGICEKMLSVVYNGIPAKRFEQWSPDLVTKYREKFNISTKDKVIGSVARIKNQDQIIRAVAKLNNPEIKILFAGIDREHLKDVIDETGLKNEIIFAGKVSSEEILNIYKLLDIKILASTMDGFGLALVEAMAMGTPVIATNFGGMKDIVEHGKNGYLYQDKNIDELAGLIDDLLKDTAQRKTIIQEGLKTATEKFTIEKTIDGYELLFQELINESTR